MPNKQPQKSNTPRKSAQTGQKKNQTAAKKKEQEPARTEFADSNDFLYLGNSPEQLEEKWFDKVKDLLNKKRLRKEQDKFTEHLKDLYDAILKELSNRCGVSFLPIFQSPDGTKSEPDIQVDAPPLRDDSQVENLEKLLIEKTSEIEKINKEKSDLETKIKKISEELTKSQTQVKKLETENNGFVNEVKELNSKLDIAKKEVSQSKDEAKVRAASAKLETENNNARKDDQKEIQSLRERIKETETERQKFKNGLDSSKTENAKLQEECEKLKHLLEDKKQNLEQIEKEKYDMKQRQITLEDNLKKFNVDKEKTERNNKEQVIRLTEENERLKIKDKELKDNLDKKDNDIKSLKEKNNILQAEKDSLEEVVNRMKTQQEKDKNKLKEEKKNPAKPTDKRLKELEEENNSLRDRLSQVAGSKLTDNNPAIADLGDPNRPTQLGEKFSELYDNEWTDAMEELGNSGDEKANISTLRNIVEKSYEFGKTRAADYVKGLEKALLSISNSIEVTPEISKFIKDHRKNTSLLVLEGLFKTFLSAHTEYNIGGDGVKNFIKKSVSLCWLMAIQDPPVILTTKLTGKFDTDRFRHYTKSGSTVDYVVWPVVYLHEGGPIICKGVAQGK